MDFTQVGQKIKRRRYELGMPQIELSQLTGIKPGNLSKIENDPEMKHSAETLYKIAKALKKKTDWLLGIEEEKQIKRTKAS
jgi:transcriptional regulator with XRE-family HTH domain